MRTFVLTGAACGLVLLFALCQLNKYRSYLNTESFKHRTPIVAFLASVAVIGFFGNSLVIVVYSLKYHRSAMRVFILSLGLCDLLTNTVAIPLQILTIRHAYDSTLRLCQDMFAVSSILSKLSGVILVAVAADRYWRVCKLHRRNLSQSQAGWVVAALTVISMMVFGSFVHIYGVTPVGNDLPGILVRMCWTSTDYSDAVWSRAFKYISLFVFLGGIVLLFVAYASIWAKVRSSSVRPSVPQAPSSEKAGRKRVSMPQNVQDPKDDSTTFKTAQTQETIQSTNGLERAQSESASTLPAPGSSRGSDLHKLDSHPTKEMEESNPTMSSSQVCATTTTEMDGPPFETSQDNRPPCRLEQSNHVAKVSFSNDVSKLKDTIPPHESLRRSQVISNSSKKATLRERLHAVRQATSRTLSAGSSRWSPASPSARSARSRRAQNHSTLMMSVLTLFYVIGWLPNIVTRWTLELPVDWCENYTECGNNLSAIFLRSFYLNSMVNAFIYSFCSTRFRQNCRALFQDWRRKLCASR